MCVTRALTVLSSVAASELESCSSLTAPATSDPMFCNQPCVSLHRGIESTVFFLESALALEGIHQWHPGNACFLLFDAPEPSLALKEPFQYTIRKVQPEKSRQCQTGDSCEKLCMSVQPVCLLYVGDRVF